MKHIELLEKEIELLLDNIKRVKDFKKENDASKYKQYSSLVYGELKHRCVALKQRLTIINKTSTEDIF